MKRYTDTFGTTETLDMVYARAAAQRRRRKAAARFLRVATAAIAGTALAGASFMQSFATSAPDAGDASQVPAAPVVASSPNATPADDQMALPAEKDETVYVYSNADGTVKNVTVSDELKNPSGAAVLKDRSNLENLVVTQSSSDFSQLGDEITWDSKSKDVHYQGDSTQRLPIEVKITYTLDGNRIEPSQLAGESGHVKIRFDYTNLSMQQTDAGDMFTPFIAFTALVMENDRFENIEVENGQVIESGERSIIAGYAMPGMQENLDIEEDVIDIPDYFEVEADASVFELDSTVTLVTSGLFDDEDTDFDTGELDSAMDALGSSSDALSDASLTLALALKQVDAGAVAFSGGVAELARQSAALPYGSQVLLAGLEQAKSGIGSVQDTGAGTLYGGLNATSKGMRQLNASANGLLNGIDSVSSSLASARSGVGEAEGLLAGISTPSAGITGIEQVRDELDALAESAHENSEAIATARSALQNIVDDTNADSASQQSAQSALEALDGAAALDTDDLRAALDGVEVETQSGSSAADIERARTILARVDGALGQLAGGMDSLHDGVDSLGDGMSSLDAGIGSAGDTGATLFGGLNVLSSGLGDIGSENTLIDGAAQLASGSQSLAALLNMQIAPGAQALALGTSASAAGAQQLAAGMAQFNDEGIHQLIDAYEENVSGLIGRLKATMRAGKNYNNFSGIEDGTSGQVKFIFETDAIEVGE